MRTAGAFARFHEQGDPTSEIARMHLTYMGTKPAESISRIILLEQTFLRTENPLQGRGNIERLIRVKRLHRASLANADDIVRIEA